MKRILQIFAGERIASGIVHSAPELIALHLPANNGKVNA
jgi:hypothetical protein